VEFYCLILTVLPLITINPRSVTIPISQSTQLTCNALGTDIVYQWMKDDVVVSGANSNMLKITNIEELDEGVYKCVVSNKGGQVESIPATIIVYGEQFIVTFVTYSLPEMYSWSPKGTAQGLVEFITGKLRVIAIM